MQYCENCGSANEPSAIFCEACGVSLTDLPRSSFDADIQRMKQQTQHHHASVDDLKRSFRKRESQMSPEVKSYLLLILGGVLIIIGLTSLLEFPSFPSFSSFPRFPSFPSTSSIVIPIGFTLLALVLIFLIARNSSRDPLIFVAIALGILSFGTAVAIPGSSSIIVPIGFILVGIVCAVILYRHIEFDSVVLLGMIVLILAFGLMILIPGSSAIIFPVGLVLLGFIACGMGLKLNLKLSSRTNKEIPR
jgi:hypothetical protein